MKHRGNDMLKKSMKILATSCLTLCLLSGVGSAKLQFVTITETQAATFTEINQDFVFVKQLHNNTCTLSSVAMMLRRAAIMIKDVNWMSITEDTIRPYAWSNGTGLRWNFTCGGFQITHGSDLGGSPEKLISLLSCHPEGIVILDRTKPHGILVTDYTDGVFYCAEPAAAYPSGRIPMDQAFLTLSNVKDYWYISNTTLFLEPEVPLVPAPNPVVPGISENDVPVVQLPNENNSVTINNQTEPYGPGDVDGNSVIELNDAQLALKAALKIQSLEEKQNKAADADASGDVELNDAQKILKHALKIEAI